MINITQKYVDRFKQYGLLASTKQALRSLVRAVYQNEHHIILTNIKFVKYKYDRSIIKEFTYSRIQQASSCSELSEDNIQMFKGFIKEGCQGIYAEIDGRIAGYAWIQESGIYHFGKSGQIRISSGFTVMKNLFVFSEYRGKRIAKQLNAARLTRVSSEKTPIVFIIPENRHAIRIWEDYAFKTILSIQRSRWFSYSWQTKMKSLANLPQTKELMSIILRDNP